MQFYTSTWFQDHKKPTNSFLYPRLTPFPLTPFPSPDPISLVNAHIDRAMGGLVSLIYPTGHAQSPQDDADLDNYEAGWFNKPSGNIGKRIRGAAARLMSYNIIGVDRDTGLIIVVTKPFKEPILLKDAQQALLISGCDLAMITDGGGSVACWSKAWPYEGGYLSREKRQIGSPVLAETVSSYLIFQP